MSTTSLRLLPSAAHPNDTDPIVTLSLVKETLRIPSDITDEDALLRLLIDSAELALEQTFGTVLRTRQYTGRLNKLCNQILLTPVPITSAPTVTYTAADSTTKTVTITDFSATPNPIIYIKDVDTLNNDRHLDKLYPFTIVATPGHSTVPKNAKNAILNIVAYMFKNREMSVMNNEDARASLMTHYLNQNAHVLNTSVY